MKGIYALYHTKMGVFRRNLDAGPDMESVIKADQSNLRCNEWVSVENHAGSPGQLRTKHIIVAYYKYEDETDGTEKVRRVRDDRFRLFRG